MTYLKKLWLSKSTEEKPRQIRTEDHVVQHPGSHGPHRDASRKPHNQSMHPFLQMPHHQQLIYKDITAVQKLHLDSPIQKPYSDIQERPSECTMWKHNEVQQPALLVPFLSAACGMFICLHVQPANSSRLVAGHRIIESYNMYVGRASWAF